MNPVNEMLENRDQLFIIAGPCAIEGREFALQTADELKKIFATAGMPFIYKSSFDKANRSSGQSYRGVGMEQGLSILGHHSHSSFWKKEDSSLDGRWVGAGANHQYSGPRRGAVLYVSSTRAIGVARAGTSMVDRHDNLVVHLSTKVGR